MKHKLNITVILLAMFFITQLIGLTVIHLYQNKQTNKIEGLPFGMQPPEVEPEEKLSWTWNIILAIFLAVTFVLLLMKFKAKWVMRIWFFAVVAIAISIALNAFTKDFVPYSKQVALSIGFILSYFKIFRRDMFVHNITELFIYPGIAVIFVPLLSVVSVSILLVLISIYDIYAVWHAGFMQEMAKFQIRELKFFAGFFVPYADKKQLQSIKQAKRSKKGKKIKVNLAILGGGDVIFPLFAAGVMLVTYGLIPALIVSFAATLGLLYLFVSAQKGKFYPAMPFISGGVFLGFLVYFLPKLVF